MGWWRELGASDEGGSHFGGRLVAVLYEQNVSITIVNKKDNAGTKMRQLHLSLKSSIGQAYLSLC